MKRKQIEFPLYAVWDLALGCWASDPTTLFRARARAAFLPDAQVRFHSSITPTYNERRIYT